MLKVFRTVVKNRRKNGILNRSFEKIGFYQDVIASVRVLQDLQVMSFHVINENEVVPGNCIMLVVYPAFNFSVQNIYDLKRIMKMILQFKLITAFIIYGINITVKKHKALLKG